MNKGLAAILFVVMVIAQLAVPASMIFKRERTLSSGTLYKFRCEPIDPYDAFRGKYVWLRVAPEGTATWNGAPLPRGRAVYVTLTKDVDGFAVIQGLQLEKPESGDFVKATVQWETSGVEEVALEYPFDRYYLEESKAPLAEIAYRESLWEQQRSTYITVYLRDGFGVINELYIDDTPILDFLEQQAEAEADSTSPDQVDGPQQ